MPAPTHCPILGIELDYFHRPGGMKRSPNAASVDRTDSTKGYIPGNVAIRSARANRLKNDATAEEAYKVYKYLSYSLVTTY